MLDNNNFVAQFGSFGSGGGGGGAGSYGIWGISDATGQYTYYTDIKQANIGAVAGDTIELFANVVSVDLSFSLKDGVNYNLNGYTFTLDTIDPTDALTDGGSQVNCTIYNGTIYRKGGSESLSDNLACYISNPLSELVLNGVTIKSAFGTCTRNAGKITGGIHITEIGFYSNRAYAYYQDAGGKLLNAECYATETICSGIRGGSIYNSYFYCRTYSAIFDNGASSIITECVAESDGATAIFQIAGGTLINCKGRSSAGAGISSNGTLMNCDAYSNGFNAIEYSPTDATKSMYNCTAFSSVNIALVVSSSVARIYNTTAKSTAGVGARGGGYFYNSVIESAFDSVNGHALVQSAFTLENVFNCYLATRNASANCINSSSPISVYYGNNVFSGATTPINANVSQSQISTEDSYGNIRIG